MNNKYKFTVPGTSQSLTIPIEINWDFFGRDDSIEVYQEDVIKEIIGSPDDFEVIRFSHDSYGKYERTALTYEFNFYSGAAGNVTASTINDWGISYVNEGFTIEELYTRAKPFTKSFFKLDFYDSTDVTKQINCFTVILPAAKSDYFVTDLTEYIKNIKVNTPTYVLDYLTKPGSYGVKEGFFYYWLKSKKFLNIDTFYMSIKFFDAKLGVFVRMMTEPQSSLPNKFMFNTQNLFYHKVVLDYNSKTYKLFNYLGQRIGAGNPIKWYEYVNP